MLSRRGRIRATRVIARVWAVTGTGEKGSGMAI